jgi:hypothetical protein
MLHHGLRDAERQTRLWFAPSEVLEVADLLLEFGVSAH